MTQLYTTDFAQSELGDIVFVEVETEGETIAKEEVFGTVEAVKLFLICLCPSVVRFLLLMKLWKMPRKVNEDPYGEGWMIRIKG